MIIKEQDTKADGNAEAYFGDNGVLGADGSGPILEHKCVGGERPFEGIVNQLSKVSQHQLLWSTWPVLATELGPIWFLSLPNINDNATMTATHQKWTSSLTLPYQVCDVDGSMNGTSNYTITAPNHCLLLCDLHIGMTIDGELNQNGEYDFLDQDGEKITDPAEVICWQGKRI